MNLLIQYFIWLPLAGFFCAVVLPAKMEKALSLIAQSVAFLSLIGVSIFTVLWYLNGGEGLNAKHFVFFKSEDIEIFLDFYFDRTTAVFAWLASAVVFVVSVFSRYYMHRDQGFKRFFTVLLLFFASFQTVVFSGNFETLFLGWEILGICSFLLIGYYQDRYLPVKNALKVISVYRLADACLILAMWMSHHLWHENILFQRLLDEGDVAAHLFHHEGYADFIILMILAAAIIKSAQFPFSSWLPRAMEGPTSSSAAFYGSLSVHAGVFLLIRTYPYWQSLPEMVALVVVVGGISALVCTGMAGVQPSVKSRIAYASAAQIGLIFIWVALGWHSLALIHVLANALYRTYQLLVSPSELSYLVHNMVFKAYPKVFQKGGGFQIKWRNTFYMLSLKEWNLDAFQRNYLWIPFKRLGIAFSFLSHPKTWIFLAAIFVSGCVLWLDEEYLSENVRELLPVPFSFLSLVLLLSAFSSRQDARRAWGLILTGQLFLTLSISLLNENYGQNHIGFYLSGTLASGVVGYFCLGKIFRIDKNVNLDRYHGYSFEKPLIGLVFLVSCLGLIGLPFTPTFVGIDLLFSHIHKTQILIVVFASLSFIFLEFALLRIYARIFQGPHKKEFHPIAFKSS